MEPIKIAVIAVAAAALLVVLANMLGLFSFTPSEIGEIEKQLKIAEARTGKMATGEILFGKGTGISARNFETGRITMGLECNTARFCCPEAQKCSGTIEWTPLVMTVKKQGKITVSTRCGEIGELLSCKSYFGELPAQLEIENISFSQEYDVREGKPKIGAKVKNTGNLPAFGVIVKAEIFTVFLEEGIEKKIKAGEKTTVAETEAINPNQTAEVAIELNISEPGKFEAEIKASGKDSGYDRKSIVFSAIKSSGNCRIDAERQKDVFWIGSTPQGDVCGKKHYCLECEYGFECVEAWEKAGILLETGNREFSYRKVSC